MKNLIVTLGTYQYTNGRERLEKSLRDFGYRSAAEESDVGNYILFTDESEVGAPPHRPYNYHFKVYAIEECLRRGWEKILWMDCSLYLVAPLTPIFDLVSQDGYYFEDSGNPDGYWTNDKCLNYFGITRDEALTFNQHHGGLVGHDFTNPITREYWDRFRKSMEAGMFQGSWHNYSNSESSDPRCKGHRHEQSCASNVRYQMGLKLQPAEFLKYQTTPEVEHGSKVITICHGIA